MKLTEDEIKRQRTLDKVLNNAGADIVYELDNSRRTLLINGMLSKENAEKLYQDVLDKAKNNSTNIANFVYNGVNLGLLPEPLIEMIRWYYVKAQKERTDLFIKQYLPEEKIDIELTEIKTE